MTRPFGFQFDNSYTHLPEDLFSRCPPQPVAAPQMVLFNHALADTLGLDGDALDSPAGASVLAGTAPIAGRDPIAQAYAGHQFGNWVPSLGDGRAIQIGEAVDSASARWGLQLKGAGPTPFSRRGDGRAAFGPVLREYVLSEAMFALGIPTTRALAFVATGESVRRERAEPGAIADLAKRFRDANLHVSSMRIVQHHSDWGAISVCAEPLEDARELVKDELLEGSADD